MPFLVVFVIALRNCARVARNSAPPPPSTFRCLPHCQYFITKGSVVVLAEHEGKELGHLHMGSHFGDTAILEAKLRTASIKADSYCDLYQLDAADMQDLLTGFPADYRRVDKNANNFFASITKGQKGPGRGRSTIISAKSLRKGIKHNTPTTTRKSLIKDNPQYVRDQASSQRPSKDRRRRSSNAADSLAALSSAGARKAKRKSSNADGALLALHQA